jgi:hypothetical protein
MNQQIRQLAEQANASFGTGAEFAVVFGELEDFKKFVELIIAECTGVLFDESERLSELSFNEDSWQAANEYEICSDQCVDNIAVIEKHFGVEE